MTSVVNKLELSGLVIYGPFALEKNSHRLFGDRIRNLAHRNIRSGYDDRTQNLNIKKPKLKLSLFLHKCHFYSMTFELKLQKKFLR